MFLNTGSGSIVIFGVKLTFEMLTAFIFDSRMDVLVNALAIWAIKFRHFLSHVFNTVSDGIDSFGVKSTFEMYVHTYKHTYTEEWAQYCTGLNDGLS